jgi:hypothetical protein
MSRTPPVLAALFALSAASLSGIPAGSRQRALLPLCEPARYLLVGDPPLADAFVTGDATVGLEGLCDAPPTMRLKATRQGTRVVATWRGCPGLRGRVKLRGVIAEGCETLEGRVKARRFRQRIRGVRSRCGDGRIDSGAAEQCEPPESGRCDDRCRRDVTAALGAAGGRITSLDGRLTLDVPAGALATEVPVTIRRLEPGEIPPAVADLQPDVAYELAPEGLRFAAPVTAALTLEAPPRAPDKTVSAPLGIMITANADGTGVEPLADQVLVVDGTSNTTTASGTLTHFSFASFVVRNPSTGNLVARVSAQASRTVVPVGQGFTVDVFLELVDVRGGRTPVVHQDETLRGGAVRYDGEPVVAIGDATPDEPRVRRTLGGYSCSGLGSGAYRGRVTAGALPPIAQLQIGIDCVQTLPTTTSTTRPTTSTTQAPTSSTRPSSTSTSTTSTSSTSSSTRSTSTTSTTSTSTTITGCCECAQGCASGPTVTEQRCESGGTVCTPGPGVFVPAAFCDESGSGNCMRPITTTTTTRPPATCRLDPTTRVCGGTCPTGLCLALPNGTCGCATPGAACGSGGPLCSSPDQACDPTGRCRPRQPCGLIIADNDLPVCFGDCPSGQLCAADRDGCRCVPNTQVCRPQSGTCGGLCASPVKTCVPFTLPTGTSGCTCVELD